MSLVHHQPADLRLISLKATGFTQHEVRKCTREIPPATNRSHCPGFHQYDLFQQPQSSPNSESELWRLISGGGALQFWSTGLSVKPSIWSTETVAVKSPYLIPPRFMRGKEYLLKIRNKRILSFWDSHPWLHAYEVVSTTTCYLCCQRRRKRGRLDKVKRSSLFKFKVLKWPIINTSDGTEAVISENNSKIISPSKARPSPGAHADMHGSDRKAKDML